MGSTLNVVDVNRSGTSFTFTQSCKQDTIVLQNGHLCRTAYVRAHYNNPVPTRSRHPRRSISESSMAASVTTLPSDPEFRLPTPAAHTGRLTFHLAPLPTRDSYSADEAGAAIASTTSWPGHWSRCRNHASKFTYRVPTRRIWM